MMEKVFSRYARVVEARGWVDVLADESV